MGWRSHGRVGFVIAAVVVCACSAGVPSEAGTFGGSVTVASTSPDDSADTGASATTGSGSGDAEASADGSDDAATTNAASSGGGVDESTTAEPVGECGDGIVQSGESCDGRDLGGTCMDYGFDDGVLVCDAECNHITDACFTCGDGEVSLAEVCDGTDFGGATCQSLGFGGGALQCSVDCQTVIDTGCQPLPSCGDGQQNGGEVCDGVDLGGATCQSQGFDLGTIACTPNCTLDLGNCMDDLTNCGHQGDFCIFSEEDPQSTCCPAGVGDNVLGLCDIFLCI